MREKRAPIAPWLAHFHPATVCVCYCVFGPWGTADDSRSFGLTLAFLFFMVGITAHSRESQLNERIAKLEALAFENGSAQGQGHSN